MKNFKNLKIIILKNKMVLLNNLGKKSKNIYIIKPGENTNRGNGI